MRRIVISSAIAAALVVAIVGGLAAVTGIGNLEVFAPESGTVSSRLTKVEGFLADNSAAVKVELSRMQRELDALKPAPEVTTITAAMLDSDPETCPTDAEQAYIDVLIVEVEAVLEGLGSLPFGELGVLAADPTAALLDLEIDAKRAAAQNIRDLTPPPTHRARLIHDTAVAMADETLSLLDAIEHAANSRNALLTMRALGDVFSPLVEGLIVFLMTDSICHLSSIVPPEMLQPAASPSAATPSRAAASPLVEEFGCQWIMDTYRPMALLGRDLAVQSLANEMMLKRGGFTHIGAGDAAQALRECEALGFE